MSFGKQTVTFCEKDQPRCVRTYGEAPCVANLGVTGSIKCHNTPKTCQDTANYLAETITVRFSRSQDGLRDYGYTIPSMVGDPSTTPARINLAGLDENMAALGAREQVTVRLHDHRHSDNIFDKYRLERAFDTAVRWPGRWRPQSFRRQGAERVARSAFFGHYDVSADPYKRGTYWGKFLARHPYYPSFPFRVREGEVGQALDDMRVRHYVLDRITGPQDGEVTLTAKDIFSKIESRKAVAPRPSLGELSANLTGSPSTFSVNPSGIGSLSPAEGGYSVITGGTQGYVAIGDEIIKVTRSGDTFTVVERGALNTKQDDHDDEDLVQLVLEYSAERVEDLLYDLLTGYSFIGASAINLPEWVAAAAEIEDLFTTRIARPTPVEDLVGELMQQAGVTLVPEVTTGMIRLVPLRAAAISPTVTDAAYIREGSLRHNREESLRVSEVWVYYGLKNPCQDIDDERNYHSRLVVSDPDAGENYGSEEKRLVKSRWIPQFGRDLASRVGHRILAMYVNPPIRASFKIAAHRGDEFALARYFYLDVPELQDVLGDPGLVAMAAISIARGENEWSIEGQSVAFSSDPVTGDGNTRTIHIENSINNLNLRTVHDTLFAAPTGSEVITFIIDPDVVVGSTSTSAPALRTGSWPAMTTAPTIINLGRVQGRGGDAGSGGSSVGGDGGAGVRGGDAFLAEVPFSVDNANGQIWSGGGGGGGGGAGDTGGGAAIVAEGSGGGGGAGTNGGTPGVPGSGVGVEGSEGVVGGADAGGDGGPANGFGGGAGGKGGGPGQNGNLGSSGTGNAPGVGGGFGAAGDYVVGNIYVNWLANGDRRGSVA